MTRESPKDAAFNLAQMIGTHQTCGVPAAVRGVTLCHATYHKLNSGGVMPSVSSGLINILQYPMSLHTYKYNNDMECSSSSPDPTLRL